MIDNLSQEDRSRTMSKIRSKDTWPERMVRSYLHSKGYRFRKHCKNLPGKPDIILPKYKIAIFVHGCFWHRHKKCGFAYMPKSSTTYWKEKFSKTIKRDKKNASSLAQLGWTVVIIWECQIKNKEFKKELMKSLPSRK